MTPLDPALEAALAGTRRRFHWLRFSRYLSLVGFILVAAVLLAGFFMVRGWLTRPGVALGLLTALAGLAILALPAIIVAAMAPQRSREWSARHVEEANPSLLDRLNALVFLRPRRNDPVLESYGRRIERQAVREMLLAARPFEEERRRLSRRWLGLLLLVLATVLFYDHFRPWQNLRERSVWDAPRAADAGAPPLEAPIADAEELLEERPEPAWGEVRITEPGRDVRVTKVDVVPLQIEAATSQALEAARWVTTPTGAEPREHALPPPEEPRFAVYRPLLYVDELRLADWDVASYYAAASTAAEEYASEIFFIEVRPFREEIEKLMEGGGQGASLMNQCTGLIERQKHVLRQTHRFLARPPGGDARAQDQEKLVTAEAELAEATRHLYAKMAAEMENQAIANVLDRLAAAEEELERATAALRESPPTAPEPEQSALAELVATRKDLQRAISENPSDFGEPSAEEPFPIAEALKRIVELRDEERTARELLRDAYELKKLLDRQAAEMGEMAERPAEHSQDDAAREAGTAGQITRELKEMVEGPSLGRGFGPELGDALADPRQESLERDLDALARAEDEAARGQAAEAAREGLEAISDAFEKSAPRTVRQLQAEDALRPGDAESLESALRQLEALMGRQGGDRPRADDDALRREAFENLRHGLEGLDGNRERVAALLEKAEETLQRDDEVDEAKLRRLLAELRQLSAELGGVEIEDLELDLAHIDPAELPAEYRERIQSYFKKLSERR